MSIPNYLYALANHKGPAIVDAGGLLIPVKIGNINHRSEYGLSDLCTFECLVVNEDQIRMNYVSRREYEIRSAIKAGKPINPFEIKKVYFNDPVTVVIWADGTKTIVRCQEGDEYSKETGLALCIAKKALGNKGNFNDVFHKWIPEEEDEAGGVVKFGKYTAVLDKGDSGSLLFSSDMESVNAVDKMIAEYMDGAPGEEIPNDAV